MIGYLRLHTQFNPFVVLHLDELLVVWMVVVTIMWGAMFKAAFWGGRAAMLI